MSIYLVRPEVNFRHCVQAVASPSPCRFVNTMTQLGRIVGFLVLLEFDRFSHLERV